MLGLTVLAALLACGKLWVGDQVRRTGCELGQASWEQGQEQGPSALCRGWGG